MVVRPGGEAVRAERRVLLGERRGARVVAVCAGALGAPCAPPPTVCARGIAGGGIAAASAAAVRGGFAEPPLAPPTITVADRGSARCARPRGTRTRCGNRTLRGSRSAP